jgi:hypothetical protein
MEVLKRALTRVGFGQVSVHDLGYRDRSVSRQRSGSIYAGTDVSREARDLAVASSEKQQQALWIEISVGSTL